MTFRKNELNKFCAQKLRKTCNEKFRSQDRVHINAVARDQTFFPVRFEEGTEKEEDCDAAVKDEFQQDCDVPTEEDSRNLVMWM